MARREPEWDWVDRAIITAHQANEALRCGGCGNYLDTTLGTDHAYMVHESVCFSCRAIAQYQDMKGRDKRWNRDGVRMWADPVPLESLKPGPLSGP